MALTITKFEILCGFVGLEVAKDECATGPVIMFLKDIEKGMTGNPEAYTELKHRLENLPDNLVVIASHTQGDNRKEKSHPGGLLFTKFGSNHTALLELAFPLTAAEKLVLLLEKEYPGDVGGLAAFLMNFVTLNPGEALCLGANELHAYVSGECIECMATSNNVVRAGLTPKKRDVETLCKMLTYKQETSKPFRRKSKPSHKRKEEAPEAQGTSSKKSRRKSATSKAATSSIEQIESSPHTSSLSGKSAFVIG